MDSKRQSNGPGNNQHSPQYANCWASLTRKRHIPPHPAQPRHTNHWAPRTRQRHQQEHQPQRPTESSNPMQHAKGRTGDCPGPRKEATTRRSVTRVFVPPVSLVDLQPPAPPHQATARIEAAAVVAKLVQPQHAAACRSMPQHAVACRSTFFLELHMGVLKHAAACRSEPKFSHGGLFFFITCRTCEPFVAQMSQNWMVAQWSMYQASVWRVLGSISGKGNFLPVSSSLLLHRSSLFWCIGKVLGTTSACLPCLSAPIEV